MYNLTEVYNGCVAISNKLTLEYGKGYNVSVAYLEVNHIYIANVKDCNDKDIQGLLFDLSQQQIQTPKLNHIKEQDSELYGTVDNREYLLIKKVKDNQIIYDIEE